jgi:putative membrane protein
MMTLGLGFGFIWMLLFWGGLIALAVWLVRLLFPSVKRQNDKENTTPLSAHDILKARYAQGELTAEEYQEMSQTIQS